MDLHLPGCVAIYATPVPYQMPSELTDFATEMTQIEGQRCPKCDSRL